jgi:hypothetical protein
MLLSFGKTALFLQLISHLIYHHTSLQSSGLTLRLFCMSFQIIPFLLLGIRPHDPTELLTCPHCKKNVNPSRLVPNVTVRKAVELFKKKRDEEIQAKEAKLKQGNKNTVHSFPFFSSQLNPDMKHRFLHCIFH